MSRLRQLISEVHRRSLWQVLAIYVVASWAVLAACGGDESPTGPTPSTIGPQGGTLSFANGDVTLVFPPGAVSQSVTVAVQNTTTFPSNSRVVGGTVYDFGPDGTRFAQPVQVTITYDPSGLPSGVQEGELRLHEVRGAAAAAWREVSGSSANTGANQVTGSITSFSVFGLLGVRVASIDVSPASGTVTVGATLQLSATPKDAEDNELGNRLVTWSSSNEGFATVSATGLVTGLAPGTVEIIATSEARNGRARLGVAGASVAITSGPTGPRQGDVVVYTAETRDSQGAVIEDPTLTWSVVPASAGLFAGDGRFVGYTPGPAEIVAATSGPADTLKITIGARGLSGTFNVVGQGAVTERFTSDLWVYGENAYTGTFGCRGDGGTELCGDRLLVWDISNPAVPVLTDSVVVDARTVNDVKVRADGAIAVISHEGSNDGLNGITLLELTDPDTRR